jgi:hypothetical protein
MMTSLLRPGVIPTATQTPSAELLALLTRLELLHGLPGTQAERDEVTEKILDVFAIYPGEADGWFRAWRALHPVRH